MIPQVKVGVRDYLPLQQGLRRSKWLEIACSHSCQRLSSTTTRIKTILEILFSYTVTGQRLSSTTTRIKTYLNRSKQYLSLAVRDYLPLQQGLRRVQEYCYHFYEGVRDYLPLQQGLRLKQLTAAIDIPQRSETIFHYNKD